MALVDPVLMVEDWSLMARRPCGHKRQPWLLSSWVFLRHQGS